MSFPFAECFFGSDPHITHLDCHGVDNALQQEAQRRQHVGADGKSIPAAGNSQE